MRRIGYWIKEGIVMVVLGEGLMSIHVHFDVEYSGTLTVPEGEGELTTLQETVHSAAKKALELPLKEALPLLRGGVSDRLRAEFGGPGTWAIRDLYVSDSWSGANDIAVKFGVVIPDGRLKDGKAVCEWVHQDLGRAIAAIRDSLQTVAEAFLRDFFDCPDITLLLEVRDDNGNKFEAPE